MTPLITHEQAVLAVVGFYAAVVGLIALATLRHVGRKLRARVVGSRVRAPEWRARRLQSGHWVVDRVRERGL